MKINACIVTGCKGDIGRSIASELKKDGLYVIGIDKTKKKPVGIDKYLCYDFHQVIDNNNVRKSFTNEILSSLSNKNLSLLVNNAAIQNLEKSKFQLTKLIESYNVNAITPYLIYKTCEKELKKNKGVLVNIGSIHSSLTKKGFGYYASSKSALKSLTNSIALDNNADILTYLIEPAAIKTKMLINGLSDSSIKKLHKYHPCGEIGSPNDIAKIISFLYKTRIKFLHGTNIDLSGGIKNLLHDPE